MKIMRNVMMVVDVLMMSCYMLEKLNSGLVVVYVMIRVIVRMKVVGLFVSFDVLVVNFEKILLILVILCVFLE